MLPELLDLKETAEDVVYRLRQDFEKGGLPGHIVLMISLIAGYRGDQPGWPLFSHEPAVLAPRFVRWLKQNPPPGGGEYGDELRHWINEY